MKIFRHLAIIVAFFSFAFLVSNCKKDSPSTNNSLEINQFIWNGLNSWYLWVDSVPNLSYNTFQNSDTKLNAFLNGYSDHEKLFYDLMYQYNVVDKWSWVVDDYTQLQNELQGISTWMGFDFGLNYADAAKTNVVGFVTYVQKGSPADNAGMKRGDLFTKINDQQLTVSNYQTLLGTNSFKISFATYSNSTLTSNGKSVTITGVQLQENPILFDTVLNVSGTNVGYLVYNGFLPGFDLQLNDVFKTFKSAGIQKLVLDLRYNGGGSIQSAIYLASMIYGTNKNQVFLQTQYNSLVEQYFLGKYGSSYFVDDFIDTIARTSSSGSPTTINTLNLTQLYVLTQKNRTASASELIINGLNAYIPVIVFGSGTIGKYVGSVTLMDYDQNGVLNPNHKWAMQPIVLKSANANGVSDYRNGFAPKDSVFENFTNIMPLGSPNEPFLKAALNDIQGIPQSSALKSASLYQKMIGDSKEFKPHTKEMYKDMSKLKLLNKINKN